MGRVQRLDFSRWARRLGLGESAERPELLETLQPVVVVGDHRSVAPRLETADGLAGYAINNVVGAFSSFGLNVRSTGGLVIHHFYVFKPNTGAAGEITYRWAVIPTQVASPGPNGVTSFNPLRPCAAAGTTRVNAVALLVPPLVPGDTPELQGGDSLAGTVGLQHMGPIWCPNGTTFVLEGIVTNQGLNGSVYFTELEVSGVSLPA